MITPIDAFLMRRVSEAEAKRPGPGRETPPPPPRPLSEPPIGKR
jgi:hypothetical protein